MRKSLNLPYVKRCKIELEISSIDDNTHVLNINSDESIFGSQPFFALKTVSGEYFHDNLDFQIPKRKWTYTFDEETLPLKSIDKIGVAANNSFGITTISNFNVKKSDSDITYLNE